MPYTRIRCYHFAEALRVYGVETKVFSYREHLASHYNGIQMLEVSDKEKVKFNLKAFFRLIRERDTVFYIQKVHYHSAMPFFLCRLGINKFILDYDDWDIDRSPFFNRAYLNRLFFGSDGSEQITGYMASRAMCCVASSKYLYDFLSQYNKNVSYIPTGVDTEQFKRREDKSNHKITFVWTGQIWGEVIYNNILYLLICFSEVCKQHNNIRFRIIGGGHLMPEVKDYVRNNYSRLEIEIIDWVQPEDMPNYLSSTDIGLLPLIHDIKNELWMKSKSPTKLFEYMAMELATVSSGIGEAKFIIEDGKDGFLAKTKEEFIEKMRLLVNNNELRIRIGKAARKKVEREYSLDVLGRRLFELLCNTFPNKSLRA